MLLLFPIMLVIAFYLAFNQTPSGIEGMSQFDVMVPGLYAFGTIFITMLVAQSFTESRETGLLKRISLTPTTSGEFVLSQGFANIFISLIQMAIILVLSLILGFQAETGVDGFIMVFFLMGLLSICSVGFGLITASISKNAGTATAFAFLFILPQMFFGTFVPLNDATKVISVILPSYYVTDAITLIFNGTPMLEFRIWADFVIVALMGVAIFFVGVQVFEKYGRK
ncbi:MAG: ABC transporter permease [Candidatus Lokiarchaeota archaeon]|nr:ABC transporter permease [Candidatus Lokiarchaeota archaeon]